MLTVFILPVLRDNYSFMLVDEATGTCAVVDPATSEPVLQFLDHHQLRLDAVYNTHHHFDHVGGNLVLKEKTGCDIYGPVAEAPQIPGIDHLLKAGDSIHVGEAQAVVLWAPGHTRGHLLYHFEKEKICFVGDTLFSLGCGRLFEGAPAEMWQSLQHFKQMPDETKLYCAHEYTLANCRFAESLLGEDRALLAYKAGCLDKQARNEPTIPTLLGRERRLNPFLAVEDAAYRARIGLADLSALEAFGEIRRQKDHF